MLRGSRREGEPGRSLPSPSASPPGGGEGARLSLAAQHGLGPGRSETMERGRGRTFSLVSAPEVLEDRGRQRRKQENPALCPLLGVGLGWAVAPGNVSVPGSPDPVHCTTVLEAGQGTGARETPQPASRTWPGPWAWDQEGTRRGHGPARDGGNWPPAAGWTPGPDSRASGQLGRGEPGEHAALGALTCPSRVLAQALKVEMDSSKRAWSLPGYHRTPGTLCLRTRALSDEVAGPSLAHSPRPLRAGDGWKGATRRPRGRAHLAA